MTGAWPLIHETDLLTHSLIPIMVNDGLSDGGRDNQRTGAKLVPRRTMTKVGPSFLGTGPEGIPHLFGRVVCLELVDFI